jgi:hypothetical protein
MRSLVSPHPAIAAGKGPFRVFGVPCESGGSCAAPSGSEPGLFNVPLETGSIQALAIRQHELGHLGLGRAGVIPENALVALKKARIHFGWAQFSLDVVVNAFMIAGGNSEVAQLELWNGTLPPDTPRWLAAMEFLRCEGLSRELLWRMSLQARAQFNRAELNLLCAIARLLQTRGAHAVPISVKELRKMLGKLQETFGPDSGDADHPLLETSVLMPETHRDKRRASPATGRNEWGPMVVAEPPLNYRCGGGRQIARKVIAGYCGAFRFPHRALLPAADGRAFGSKRRFHGGTILIDGSGSMHLTTDELSALVSRSLAATVAIYAGLPGDESGSLRIVAKNGRFTPIEEVTSNFGKGNVVDGHALRWLSRQPGPRIWVSDGIVTGLGDKAGANLDLARDRILRDGRIKRIDSLDGC